MRVAAGLVLALVLLTSPGFSPAGYHPTISSRSLPAVFVRSGKATTANSPSIPSGSWTKDSGTDLAGAQVPFVVALPDGRYRMYYCGQAGILSAISSDGLNWTPEAGVRLAAGAQGSQESIVCDPTVIQLDDGRYRMYYDGTNQAGSYQDQQVAVQIYSAISSDGLNFQREGVRISSSGAVANGLAAVPEVVRTFDGRYRLYYVSNRVFQPSYEDYLVSAVSNDGLNFTSEGVVGGVQAQRHDPAVIEFQNGTYWAFVACGSPVCLPPGVFSARSTDGRNFVPDSKQAVVYASSYGVVPVDPSVVLFPDGTYRMYYWYDCSCSSPPSVVSVYWKPANPTPKGFNLILSSNRSSLEIPSQGTLMQTYPLKVSWPPNFLGNVSITASWSGATPGGANLSASPSRVTAYWKNLLSANASVTVAVSPSARPGNYSLVVSGSGDGMNRSAELSIDLLAPSIATTTSTTTTASSTTATTTVSTNSASTTHTTSTTITTIKSSATSSSTSTTLAQTTTTSTPVKSTASSSARTTSTAGGGGVPEFTYEPVAASALIVVLIASYLLVRRRSLQGARTDGSQR